MGDIMDNKQKLGGYLNHKLILMDENGLLDELISGEIKFNGKAKDCPTKLLDKYSDLELGELKEQKINDRIDFETHARTIYEIAEEDYIMAISWDRKIRDYDIAMSKKKSN